MANFGLNDGATWADGDFDSSGSVTLADVMIARANFTPPTLAGPPANASAVPEPAGLALCIVGAFSIAFVTKRRR
jgi:hypothetical protein